MPRRCICDRSPQSHEYHGKKRRGTLSSHRAAVHLSSCPHSELKKTTRRHRPVQIKSVPGTRKLIAVELPESKRGKRK